MVRIGARRVPWYVWMLSAALALAFVAAYLAFRVVDPWTRDRAEVGRIGTPFAGWVVTGSSRGGGLLCLQLPYGARTTVPERAFRWRLCKDGSPPKGKARTLRRRRFRFAPPRDDAVQGSTVTTDERSE
jgi:hypothetical protein